MTRDGFANLCDGPSATLAMILDPHSIALAGLSIYRAGASPNLDRRDAQAHSTLPK